MNNVDLISNAPNGIESLRASIMKMAVNGKLNTHCEKDESVEVLLKKIEEEKESLFKSKILNKDEVKISIKENLLQVPEKWICLELKDVFYSISPGNKKIKTKEYDTSGKYPIIDQGQTFIAGYINDQLKVIRIPGPVVIFGDHTRIIKYVDFDFVPGADGVKVLRPIGVYEKYFYLYLKSLTLEDRGYSRHFKILKKQLFALPPFEEQKRIVAKVDQLMALCDDLEAKQEKQTRTRRQLNDAALNALLSAISPEEFEKNWQRIVGNFDLLYDDLDNLQTLRKAILQMAVQGNLSQQTAQDEPAINLLRAINKDKNETSKFEERVGPVTLPSGWSWANISDVSIKVQYGFNASAQKNGKAKLLRITDIQNNRVNWEAVPFCDISKKELDKYRLNKHDLLIARTGGTIGKSFQVDSCPEDTVFASYLIRIIPSPRIYEKYFKNFADSALYWKQLREKSMGTGQPNVNGTSLSNLLFPVPPFEEQKRIVAKVDQLMILCDELEKEVAAKSAHLEKLTESLLKV